MAFFFAGVILSSHSPTQLWRRQGQPAKAFREQARVEQATDLRSLQSPGEHVRGVDRARYSEPELSGLDRLGEGGTEAEQATPGICQGEVRYHGITPPSS